MASYVEINLTECAWDAFGDATEWRSEPFQSGDFPVYDDEATIDEVWQGFQDEGLVEDYHLVDVPVYDLDPKYEWTIVEAHYRDDVVSMKACALIGADEAGWTGTTEWKGHA